MKLKYKYQDFQKEAAQCVTDIFKGQPNKAGVKYLVDPGDSNQLFEEIGFGNWPLTVDLEKMTENVREIQMRQGLKPIEKLQGLVSESEKKQLKPSDRQKAKPFVPAFTIEMETGTGKTYTYIKTMYELNKRYGWSKFIIVVPSVAIREGVHKSFESMREHFAQ